MDKYLLQILLDVNTIIIPGLGALTVTNAKTGEMMFMSYLKYDDGKLAAYISEKEGMSENDAKNLIAKYVREIQAKLDQGQTYDMFKFGRFLKNKDGEIDFESWGSYSPGEEGTESAGSASETETETEETTVPAPESVTPDEKPEVTATADEPEIHSESSSVPEFSETASEPEETKEDDVIEDLTVMSPASPSLDDILEKAEEKAPEPAEAPEPESTPEPVIETTPIADQTPDESRVQVENIYIPPGETHETTPAPEPPKPAPDLDKNKGNIGKKPVQPAEPRPRKKRGAGFWVLIVVIALLVIGGTSTLLFYDKVKQFLPFLESKRVEAEQKKDSVTAEELNESAEALEAAESERITTENQAETPAAEAQPEAETSAVEETQPAPVAASTDESKPYHVIAGAFASRENADKYAAKNNFSVIGQYDGMYLVSSGSYDSRSAAQSSMNGKGWIFKKR